MQLFIFHNFFPVVLTSGTYLQIFFSRVTLSFVAPCLGMSSVVSARLQGASRTILFPPAFQRQGPVARRKPLRGDIKRRYEVGNDEACRVRDCSFYSLRFLYFFFYLEVDI